MRRRGNTVIYITRSQRYYVITIIIFILVLEVYVINNCKMAVKKKKNKS